MNPCPGGTPTAEKGRVGRNEDGSAGGSDVGRGAVDDGIGGSGGGALMTDCPECLWPGGHDMPPLGLLEMWRRPGAPAPPLSSSAAAGGALRRARYRTHGGAAGAAVSALPPAAGPCIIHV